MAGLKVALYQDGLGFAKNLLLVLNTNVKGAH